MRAPARGGGTSPAVSGPNSDDHVGTSLTARVVGAPGHVHQVLRLGTGDLAVTPLRCARGDLGEDVGYVRPNTTTAAILVDRLAPDRRAARCRGAGRP